MSEAERRTGLTGARWREVWRKSASEVDRRTERFADEVGHALGAPARVVGRHP